MPPKTVSKEWKELNRAAKAADRLWTRAEIVLSTGRAQIQISATNVGEYAGNVHVGVWEYDWGCPNTSRGDPGNFGSLAAAVEYVEKKWGRVGSIRPESIRLGSSNSPIKGAELKRLIRGVWLEICGGRTAELATDPAKAPSGTEEGRVAGKTFAFTGKLGRWDPIEAARRVEAKGGTVLEDVKQRPDYLVVGEIKPGRPSPAVKSAQTLNARTPNAASIQILTEDEFSALFSPNREQALAMLTGGKAGLTRWRELRGDRHHAVPMPDLSGADLRNAKLGYGGNHDHRISLYGVKLDGADLSGADLRGAHLSLIRGAKLDGCRLQDSQISEGLIECSVLGADLSEANLNPSNLERSDFSGSKMVESNLPYAHGAGAVFRDADLRKSRVFGAAMQGADFTAADLTDADLSECDLTGAVLRDAKLTRAKLRAAVLSGADLRGADLRGAILSDADLRKAQIDGADFTGAETATAKLTGLDRSLAKGLEAARKTTAVGDFRSPSCRS